ncbi:hypothetical protein [Enterococcus xiangfangensis]|uniref:Uncharacterized protein n=1 Tax=Enterococcus xiangfangensis TaxID=1296537 RepID=A0ABU3F9D1_9ENTE|nr:hypothetical protein [Enterococcus xiangfangensis]MDT2759288.1 hypothetical protein [Enterococcus xiangfangensis]
MNKQEKEELVNQLNSRLSNCPSDSWDRGYNEGIKTAGIVVRNMHTVDEPQKVKVPELPSKIAKYLEWAKEEQFDFTEDYNMISWEDLRKFGGDDTEYLQMWFFDNDQKENERRHILFLQAYTDGYEVEESKWVVNEGDLVIRKGEHEAKVYFVEGVDDDGILLVNGIKDEFFTDLDDRSVGEESINYFYENFRLLAKKENLEVEKVEV